MVDVGPQQHGGIKVPAVSKDNVNQCHHVSDIDFAVIVHITRNEGFTDDIPHRGNSIYFTAAPALRITRQDITVNECCAF